MTMREMVEDAFDTTLDGLAKRCSVDGNKKAAVELSAELMELSNAVVEAIADDGKMDDDERAKIKALFREKLSQRITAESFWFLDTTWGIVKKWLKSLQEKIRAKIGK